MIVDDEPMVRVGLKSLIHWEEHGCQIVGEATNGLEALVLSRIKKPDIILVDIIMPEMDGIELIAKVQEELPFCKYIIISCLDEIGFYKKIIGMDISEYLIKNSLNEENILKAIDKISKQLKKQRVFGNAEDVGQQLVNEYLVLNVFMNMVIKREIKDSNVIEEKLRTFNIEFTSRKIFVMILSVNFIEPLVNNYNGALDYSIVSVCQEILKNIGGGYIFKNYEDNLIVIITCPDSKDCNRFISVLFYRIQETLKQYFDVLITASVSNELRTFSDLYIGYKEALYAMDSKFFNKNGNIYYSFMSSCSLDIHRQIIAQHKAISCIKSIYELEELKRAIKQLFTYFYKFNNITSNHVIVLCSHVLYHIIALLNYENLDENYIFGSDFSSTENFSNVSNLDELCYIFEDILEKINLYIHSNLPNIPTKYVNSIKKYINDNINRKISLDDISKNVNLSREYICRLFRKETGENITKYIQSVKVQESKKLLLHHCNLSSVMDELDINSESYFIKIFKEQTGLTPMQYIKKFTDKK